MKIELLILLVCGGAFHFCNQSEEDRPEQILKEEKEKSENNFGEKKKPKKESKVK